MTRYFFDIQDGDARIPDEEGMIFPNVEAAREEATMSLADLARDRVRERRACSMAIEVRDEKGPVAEASLEWTDQRRH
jgi:hypothetical protein